MTEVAPETMVVSAIGEQEAFLRNGLPPFSEGKVSYQAKRGKAQK